MEEREIIQDDEINLLDYLIVLAKRKKLIIGVTLLTSIITAGISLNMPPIYMAETKILPPQQGSQSMASQIMSQLGGFAGLAGGAVGIKTTNDLYIGLLKSRPVLDPIIDNFKLMDVYEAKYRDDARNGLAGALKARDDKKSGIITIGIEDKDPKRAADMANAFVEGLKDLTNKFAVTEAAQRRLFFEEQLKNAKESLVKAEESIMGFQERTGAIKIDEQTKAVLTGIAQLRGEVAAKEVQLLVMKTYATPQNPDIQRVEEEIRGLKEQLDKLEHKEGSGNNPDPLMPTGRIPSLGTEYIRKMREFKYNETLYEIFLKQYEAARLDEAKEAAVIQVLEKAIPPEKRVKPKRRQMVMIAGVTGLFASIFLAFFMEYREKISDDPENRKRLEILRRYTKFRSS
ncbi:MAG: hypothetical protein A3I04_02595 [Nitrospinae bacterium RIFCSPLOWO2_02_FULL_39_110]|nr:MAG: hypothetical protein A2Z59_03500 [Nitrospinae bacterium RIFCSPLOWO2_02_39_17]OGW05936.1 MAG: hypothetical protein A3I04_02595 [Nitrospinae bacterium RIFCSPLOWO2_02_FULL_39_110]OGW08979.1 MAG: hypothetical protein A2W75_00715 [Nitrospinae bacterium RIFCSPLOWO2_12_39_15]OGW11481.1 MAG: hypothetical protein A3F81_05165 [Nitrospinae bacterium RIFCSPLOWO2_12_FULL_39_93]HLA47843.1 Wzz/FepE/Etk N-terminal domain-containing protein [Nitrospinota bacterium]